MGHRARSGGAQRYSGSLATPVPQAFNMASLPDQETGFGVDPPVRGRAGHTLYTGPYPPGGVRKYGGRLVLDSLFYVLRSGGPGAAELCAAASQGALAADGRRRRPGW